MTFIQVHILHDRSNLYTCTHDLYMATCTYGHSVFVGGERNSTSSIKSGTVLSVVYYGK